MEFRSALFVWFLVELLSLLSSVFIWLAIFRTHDRVGQYDLENILLYYLLVPIVGAISSIYISEILPDKIKLGELSAEIIKPYGIALGYFAKSLGTKLTQLSIKAPIYLIIIFAIHRYTEIELSSTLIFFGLLAAFLGLILHFLIDFCISCVAFWSDSVWYLSHLKFVILMVFGGLSFPLDLLPPQLASIFNFLPFKYIYFVPVKIASGSIGLAEVIAEIGLFGFWLFVFALLTHVLWNKGIKRYGAYGN